MIGRFLLGAGLGGLVGVGLLVTVSLLTPLRDRETGLPAPATAPAEPAGPSAAPAPVSPDAGAAPPVILPEAADASATQAADPSALPEVSLAAPQPAPEPRLPEAAELAAPAAPPAPPAAPVPDSDASQQPAVPNVPDEAAPPLAEAPPQALPAGPVADSVTPPAATTEPPTSEPVLPDAATAPAARTETPAVAPPADLPPADLPPVDLPPEAVTEAPSAPPVAAATAGTDAPPAPSEGSLAETAPVTPDLPHGLAAPPAEAGPEAPARPAAAPELAPGLADGEAPSPSPVPAARAEDPARLPQPAETAGVSPTPVPPLAPRAEGVPPAPDLPAPPPLTPEEEALLADRAPPPAAPGAPAAGMPSETVPAPPPAAEKPAADLPAEGSAPPTLPAVLPLPGEGTLEADADRRLALGEDATGTLPSTPSLIERKDIRTDRLPRIGEAPAGAQAESEGETAETPAQAGAAEIPRLAQARPFENPAGKPMLSLILIDTGEEGLDRSTLAGLPFPVTFALDPMAPGSAERAALYRAAGQEVVMLATAIPEGAAAADVEQAFQVMAQNLPQAVAVMEPPGRGFRGNRKLAGAVVPIVGAQGRGLVTWDEGLNAADQVARRERVPAAVVFRALDAEAESTPVIRRYLDRAAFKAAQEGRVAVVGQTRPETIAALLEWAVEGRAATVALAPLSAVLATD